MSKILMPIGDATETLDTFYPFFRLAEAGYEVVVAGPDARLYHTVLHEIPPDANIPWDITQERPGYHIEATVAFRDINPEDYAGLFISGGRAPEYIREDEDLLRITKYYFEKNAPIASVCHGVEIPARADCVRGRRMATVPKAKFDLEVCGGTFVDEPCVIDGNLVSGRTFWDHGHYMGAWMKLLDIARSAGG